MDTEKKDNITEMKPAAQPEKPPTPEQQAFALLAQLAAAKYNDLMAVLEKKVNS
jgi:hypothetical protein